jgi:2-dehydropantoate 2-reductase
MTITIVGTGAMASLIGGRLTPLADVTLIGSWAEGIAALKSEPLQIIGVDDSESVLVSATSDPMAVPPADIVLVLTKSTRTTQAAAIAAQVLKPEGIAITLQNGLGNLEVLQERLGTTRVALGVTSQGATLLGPGKVKVGGRGITTLAFSAGGHSGIAHLAELFRRGGLDVDTAEDVTGLVWSKLAVNAGINPLTAILGIPNGKLIGHLWAEAMMRQAAREVGKVAVALGITLHSNPVESVEEVARQTAPNISSMLQDIRRGTVTEIEAICGQVVRYGQTVMVSTPVNEALLRMVREIEHSITTAAYR